MEKRLRQRIIVIALLVLALGLPAIRYGPRLYSRWEQHRLVGQARTLIKEGDFRKAALGLRRAIELNPTNLEASRLYADLAEIIGKRDAVFLRERICVMAPGSFDDAYAWASTALRFGDRARAQDALGLMRKTGPERGGFHAVLGLMARDAGQPQEARAQFAKALEAEPKNDAFQFEAAMLDLGASDAVTRQAARQTLERLRAMPAYHQSASRALVAADASRRQFATAVPMARELATDPHATFQDRLLYLGALHAGNNPQFAGYLTDVQTTAREKPGEAALLVGWANAQNLVLLSKEWLATLPPEMVAKPPLAQKAAETYVSLGEWKLLHELTANPGWGEDDYLRLAYFSRALLEEGDPVNSDLQWKAAIALMAKRAERLDELARLAATWGWTARNEDLLWFIATTSKRPLPALRSLVARYSQTQDSRNLQRALTSLWEANPSDVAVKNNWVMLSLLMRTDLERAAQAAKELYEARPADPHSAATYAFALYATNRTDDGLDILRKLTPEQQQMPTIAVYYGVLLAAVRDPEAPKFLELAKKAKLLPEEEQLVAKAQRDLAGG